MIKIKKIIKWFFLIIILIVAAFIGFIILTETGIIKLPKDPIPTLQETKFENIEEWYDDNKKCKMIKAKYIFDGLNGVGYYQKKLQINETQIAKLKDKIDQEIKGKNNSFKILELKNELENIGTATYGEIFFDKIEHKYLNENKISSVNNNNISYRLESQTEPDNLANYIKDRYPFDRWNNKGITYDMTTANGFKFSQFDDEDDSQLYLYVKLEKQQHEGPGNNKLIVKYQGPKHFLEEDQDYYLGRARVSDSNFELTNFHLHFNPIRKTLSIFKDKHNYDKVKEAEIKNRQKDDW